MKKLLYSLLAVAAAMVATSCQKVLENGAGYDGTTVNAKFSVNLGSATKALADGTTVDKLYAGVYEVNGTTYTWVADNADAPATISSKAANVSFNGKIELGKSYKVVFWAQKQGAPYAIDWAKSATTGPAVTVTATGDANAEARDAFFGVYETGTVTGSIDLTGSPISLKRPFAQVNVLVPNANIADLTAAVTSSMTVAQAPTVLNLITKETSDPADWTFSATPLAESAFGSYASTHKYVAMNYVLVDQVATDARYDVTFSVTCGSQSVADKALANMPLKANGRTNIIGNIFDSNFDITVPIIVDPGTGTEQELTMVTVTVGQNPGNAVALDAGYNADPTQRTAIPIEVAVSHPVEVEADEPEITVNPATVATAEWNLTTGKLDVTPLVENGAAAITLVFPAVTKTEYSSATVELFVRVGNGINPAPKEDQTLTFANDTENATLGSSYTLQAVSGAQTDVTYTSSEATVATIEGTTVTLVGAGSTIITATAAENDTYNSASATYTLTVSAPATPDFTTVSELKGLLGAESATLSGTLTDAVVSFVASTSDAVIKDVTGSILYHKDAGHGLLQGQTISGDVIVDAVIYNGINEITDLAATVEGEGCAVEPELVTLYELSQDYAKYESAYVKVVGVTSLTTTTAKGNITGRQDATDYIIYTNVAIPVNAGDVFSAEGTITRYNVTEELKVWKTSDLTVTTPAPVISATPATTTVAASETSVTWNITSNTDWTITPGAGVTPSTTSGNGNAEVTLSFAANESSDAATYTATVSADGCPDVTITITQNGVGEVTPISISVTPATVTTNTSYGSYENANWIMTCGSANGSFGCNSKNADTKMKLGDNYVVATPLDSSIDADATHYAAMISKNKLDAGITRIVLGGTLGTGMTVGVTVSTNGTTWTELAALGTTTDITFDAQDSVYYAVVIKANNKSNATYTSFSATFTNSTE